MATATKKRIVTSLDLSPHQIVIKPLVTEKGIHKASRHNRYVFQVNPLATKVQIKAAIEELFNVKVTAVATQNRKGKSRRYKAKEGVTKAWKKAIVKLHEDNKLEFF